MAKQRHKESIKQLNWVFKHKSRNLFKDACSITNVIIAFPTFLTENR